MQRIGVRAPILLIGGILITLTLDPVLALVLICTLPFITVVVYEGPHDDNRCEAHI